MREMRRSRRASRDNMSRQQGYGRFKRLHIESTRCIKAILIERGSTSRERNAVVDLRDLLEEFAEASELLKVKSRVW